MPVSGARQAPRTLGGADWEARLDRLADMGYDRHLCGRALELCGGDIHVAGSLLAAADVNSAAVSKLPLGAPESADAPAQKYVNQLMYGIASNATYLAHCLQFGLILRVPVSDEECADFPVTPEELRQWMAEHPNYTPPPGAQRPQGLLLPSPSGQLAFIGPDGQPIPLSAQLGYPGAAYNQFGYRPPQYSDPGGRVAWGDPNTPGQRPITQSDPNTTWQGLTLQQRQDVRVLLEEFRDVPLVL